MSILNYFKAKDGLPNPKGPLSLSIPSQAIALANRDVAKATVVHSDRKNCAHKPALRQLLLSILLDKCGSLEYSRVFQTLPCSRSIH